MYIDPYASWMLIYERKPCSCILTIKMNTHEHTHTHVRVFSSFKKDFNQRSFSVSEYMYESCAWNRKKEICDWARGQKLALPRTVPFFSCKNARPGQGYHLMKIYNQSDVSVQREFFFIEFKQKEK